MFIDYNSIELEQSDLDSLHDTIAEALDKWPIGDDQIIDIWKQIPNHIKAEAVKWGVNDTVVKDDVYVWIKENLK